MVISIILLIVIGGIAFLLCAPIVLEVDTSADIYEIRFTPIAKVNLAFTDTFVIRMNIIGFRKEINPFETRTKNIVKDQKPRKKKKRSSIPIRKLLRKGIATLRTFDVKYFYLNIDTDDYVKNALLFPAAVMISKPDRIVRVNFNGEFSVKLKIQNRIGRMIFAFLT